METKGTQESGKMSGASMTQNKPNTMPGQAGYSSGAQGGQGGQGGQGTSGSAVQRARDPQAESNRGQDLRSEINREINRAAEVVEHTKQVVSDAYDRTSRNVQATYDHAVDYGRENPGKVTLIAFGAGIGVGLLIASSLSSSRSSRRSRIVSPVMNALSDIAVELFR